MICAKRLTRDWKGISQQRSCGIIMQMDLPPNEKPRAAEKLAGAAPAESEQF
jgi:hypothetical protein